MKALTAILLLALGRVHALGLSQPRSLSRGPPALQLSAASAPSPSPRPLGARALRRGWRERTAADPRFAYKATTEVVLATVLQLAAEAERRRGSFTAEIDYAIAGVLTAIAGKGYASWATSPTLRLSPGGALADEGEGERERASFTATNAFQHGSFSLARRVLAIFSPMPRLFAAGAASAWAG